MNIQTKQAVMDFAESCYIFNEVAGKHDKTSLADLKKQMLLIQEEVQEIADGLEKNNPEEVLDGVIDTLVVTIGMLQKLENLGFNAEEAMERTAANNLSKFPSSIETLDASVKMYKTQGINVSAEYNTKYNAYVIKDTNEKVRKPFNFVANDLACCIPEEILNNGFKKV